ncbi:hypothetical protein [Saccharococcus sp. Marseille-Q5394]|uniref:hypothetical protein n=1 Tax=Saccharococcus sp. Marseille-Q5394 TaxID=2972778 RepID=UPI0021C59EDC|nr:hypothetical protein [Saccharococcus sp. Marseille-Q5394]
MENRYRVFDSKDNKLYVGVCSNYFKIADAKNTYRNSTTNADLKDDSILIEIAKSGANEVDAVVSFGVNEGEQFALALLNLCNSIKN